MSTGYSPSQESACLHQREIQGELQRLQDFKVIAPVNDPTKWVSQFVVAVKNSGELPVCVDPKALNAALKRERYQILVIDELLPDLAEARVFTKVDLTSAFRNLVLENKSCLLTTFATPHGRHHRCCLPFGLCVSSEIFEKHLNQELLGLPGVKCIADDMLNYGRDNADHSGNLEGFMKRCQPKIKMLNPTKLEYKCEEVTFHRHLLTTEGLKSDLQKIRAIVVMP